MFPVCRNMNDSYDYVRVLVSLDLASKCCTLKVFAASSLSVFRFFFFISSQGFDEVLLKLGESSSKSDSGDGSSK